MRVSTNEDLTSQLSMVTVLTDANNSAAIVHFASWKSRQVFRSPIAANSILIWLSLLFRGPSI